MSDLDLSAARRTILGKKVKQLRRLGGVPGVIYGPAVAETVPVTIDRRAFDRFYQTNGHSTLFTLRWEGGEQAVFIREVQQDPVRHDPIHIDFFAPRLDQLVRATVPLVLHHANPNADGVLSQLRTEIEVEALPRTIPHQLDIDISGLLAVGDSLRVVDLSLPTGVTVVTAMDEVVAQLTAEAADESADEAADEAAAAPSGEAAADNAT